MATVPTVPTVDYKQYSPHIRSNHRRFPSANTMSLPPSTNTLARQPSSSMSSMTSMDFQPSSPAPKRSPMQSPVPSPRTFCYPIPIPTLDRSTSRDNTPRSITPNFSNFLPSADELILQNIKLALRKCMEAGIITDQQSQLFLNTYNNL